MIKKSKAEVVAFINEELSGYEGYVQFSHRPLNKNSDIFIESDPKVEDESGFIYEAHFCNGKTSVSIHQLDASWYISKTELLHVTQGDKESYLSHIQGFNYKIVMAQIWEPYTDDLCEGMQSLKIKKVVFAGFKHGGER